jgi:hypothetical protein
MPDSMFFGGYRGGYNAMPQGWMNAATQVGKNYAQGIQSLGSSLVTAAGTLAGGMQQTAQNQQSLPTNMSQYEQVTQATGQQMDPTIIERFANRNDLSGAGLMQLNKDIAGAQQNALNMAGIQRQQALFEMQQQAAARAAQNQGNPVERNTILGLWGMGR